MNRVNHGLSCAIVALAALLTVTLSAQQTPPSGRGRGAAPAPATQGGSETVPQKMGDQSTPISATVTTLGPVRIPKGVKADGQPLPAGTYQMRVTERLAS